MKELETTKLQKHPLEIFADKIEENGCMVLDRNHTLPAMPYPYVSPQFIICIGHTGHVDLEYDSTSMTFEEKNIAVVYPNHSVRCTAVSSDYNSSLVVVSSALFEKLRMRSAYRGYYQYLELPHFKLKEEQYNALQDVLNVIRIICNFEKDIREEMLIHILDVFVTMITKYRLENFPSKREETPEKRLFIRFYDSIVVNYRKSREVQFYADFFCLSPKYFGTLIRNETGVGAGDWIARYVVMQAKMLLRGRVDRDIQWVATELGFDDQASFSRYFKRVEGITPSEFRAKARGFDVAKKKGK